MGITKRENFNETQNKISILAKTVSHPARVAILQRIFTQKGTICNDLVTETGLSQPSISQHLNELKKSGLIQGTTDGTRMCYQIVPEKWEDFKKIFYSFLALDEDIRCNGKFEIKVFQRN